MTRKTIFYIVFFAVLVVGFYIGLTYAIPGFASGKKPIVGKVKPFSFINQDGKRVTDKDVAGKVNVVNFFFTTCTTICPRMNSYLKPVYDQFKNEPGVVMLSFTSDPERDSALALRRYADSLNVDTEKWIFLTGRKDSLYNAARNSYYIDNPKNYVKGTEDLFLHTQFIALVNKKGEVVNVYDGIKPSEIKEMQIAIEKLLKQ